MKPYLIMTLEETREAEGVKSVLQEYGEAAEQMGA